MSEPTPAMPKFKKARTLAQAYADPRVEDHSDERGPGRDPGDGIWLYLRHPFFNSLDQTTSIHEWSVEKLLQILNSEFIVEDPDKRS